MEVRLGGELQLKDAEIKTSTIESQKLFLSLIPEMVPDAVYDLLRLFNTQSLGDDSKLIDQESPNYLRHGHLIEKYFLLHTKFHEFYSEDVSQWGWKSDVRATPVLAFFDFIFTSDFDSELAKSETYWNKVGPGSSQELKTHWALKKMLPSWEILQTKTNGEWLCLEINKWADAWNLKDDWCKDFAIDCLRLYKTSLIDGIYVPEEFISKEDRYAIWHLFRNRHFRNIWVHAVRDYKRFVGKIFFTWTIANYPELRFIWNLGHCFEVVSSYDPYWDNDDEFRREVEERFWQKFFECDRSSFIGKTKLVKDEIARFLNDVEKHILDCREVNKPFSEPAPKKESDRHFRWLVEFQILGKSKYKIAEELKDAGENKRTRKAIKDGIEDVARLMNLTLRPDSKGGRKIGSKDKETRQYRR